jgi:hypothetical protein
MVLQAIAAVAPQRPCDRPFDAPLIFARKVLLAGEELGGGAFAGADLLLEVIAEAAGELEHGFGRRLIRDQRGIALPADLDAGEQIGFGARELVEPRGLEQHLAEDFHVGRERHRSAAPVGRGADLLDRPEGQALAEALAVEQPIACDFDYCIGGERVDHRHADAVQAAGGGVRLAREFAARMEHREDHLERRLVGKSWMRIDRHATAIVDDRQPVALLERDLDTIGMARHGLVHRIVEDLGGEVMERALVGAADIHAGAAPDRLQPFEHFDRRCVIGPRRYARGGKQVFSHAKGIGSRRIAAQGTRGLAGTQQRNLAHFAKNRADAARLAAAGVAEVRPFAGLQEHAYVSFDALP